ncbi:MAG: divalent-cation tolerance protein CutA [Candidatus Omnitrophica bacterium]|nr:divalent-cation tolerance protein CutA [Candidatus Omnitrophota bacterium]
MEILFTSFSNKKDAKKFAIDLVKKKLTACANFYKANSCYIWNKKLILEAEWILELKGKNLAKAFRYLQIHHPYSCPMIYILKTKNVAKKYLKWLEEINE